VFIVLLVSFKRLLWLLLLGLLVAFIVREPGDAARVVKVAGENAGEWFSTAAESFTKFLQNLV
jgi:hypothetical protein